MIHAVRANNSSFQEVEFKSGLNIVLADRTRDSTKKDSRNGLGKTTLIEIIHFCMGATVRPGRGLRAKSLHGWVFSLELSLNGRRFVAHRDVDNPGKIEIEGDLEGWKGEISFDGWVSMPATEWTTFLGSEMFNLPKPDDQEVYLPTFRSLVSYIARRGRDGFLNPFEYMRKQREWNRQVNVAYLLGLSWENARAWQKLKDDGKTLNSMKKAISSGLMKGMVGKLGEIEAEKVRLEEIERSQAKALKTFKVHDEYRQIEKDATRLTGEIHQLSNQSVADRRMLDLYREGLVETRQPETEEITDLYEQFGVQLPGIVVRRLDDVRNFHHELISNRKEFLGEEIRDIESRVQIRGNKIRELTEERAKLMLVLEQHGALEDFNHLQQRHLETQRQLNDIKTKIENLRNFEAGKSALKIEQEKLHQRARRDHDERREIRERAISLFNTNSQSLYQAPGRLVIDIGDSGFNFDVEIERSGSEGIESMKIFCYDLMLAELWANMPHSPGFLIHDSTLFDGVDERQVALALERAAQVSIDSEFQYICTFNSDAIPENELSEKFEIEDYVRLRLTDATPAGSLLGFRY